MKKQIKTNSALPQIDGVTVHCAHSGIVSVGELKPYPRNNAHFYAQQKRLSRSRPGLPTATSKVGRLLTR
jgi:hypothetical protein